MTTTTRTKGSGGRNGSGARLMTTPPPVASTAPSGSDDDRVLTVEELFDLLRLKGAERCDASIASIPCAVVGETRRWLKGQVLTHLALGGDARRVPTRHTRTARVP